MKTEIQMELGERSTREICQNENENVSNTRYLKLQNKNRITLVQAVSCSRNCIHTAIISKLAQNTDLRHGFLVISVCSPCYQ